MSVTKASLLQDNYGSSASGTAPVGSIVIWGGRSGSVPDGWVICNGAYLSKTQYPDLYNAFTNNQTAGNPHGPDDPNNSNNFKIPDLRSRFVICTNGVDINVGSTGGSADAVVVEHEHFIASTTGYEGNESAKAELTSDKYVSQLGVGGSSALDERRDYVLERSISEANVGRTSSTGESGIGKNLPPYYALAFIIRVS